VLKLFRKHRIWIAEIFLFVAAFLAISSWQARNLLDTDRQAAPQLQAETLDGVPFDIAETGNHP